MQGTRRQVAGDDIRYLLSEAAQAQNSSMQRPKLSNLPEEMVLAVFKSCLSSSDAVNLSNTCRRYKRVFRESSRIIYNCVPLVESIPRNELWTMVEKLPYISPESLDSWDRHLTREQVNKFYAKLLRKAAKLVLIIETFEGLSFKNGDGHKYCEVCIEEYDRHLPASSHPLSPRQVERFAFLFYNSNRILSHCRRSRCPQEVIRLLPLDELFALNGMLAWPNTGSLHNYLDIIGASWLQACATDAKEDIRRAIEEKRRRLMPQLTSLCDSMDLADCVLTSWGDELAKLSSLA